MRHGRWAKADLAAPSPPRNPAAWSKEPKLRNDLRTPSASLSGFFLLSRGAAPAKQNGAPRCYPKNAKFIFH